MLRENYFVRHPKTRKEVGNLWFIARDVVTDGGGLD